MNSPQPADPDLPDGLEGITFRDCTPEDIPLLFGLWDEAGALPTETDNEHALGIKLKRDPELFVLAFDGHRLVGSIMGGWDGWRANMYRLAVAHSHRRRGIGTHLVQIVEDRFVEKGAERVYSLAVKPELEPAAIKFWVSVGYELHTRALPYVKMLVE